MEQTYKRVLTIAGSDPSGGAGIQADIKTISALGCFATSAIVAVVDENTLGVTGVHPVPVDFVVGQIHSVLDDIGTDAVKIGMLHSSELVRAVRRALDEYPRIRDIVLDPVMVATSGDPLLEGDAVATLRDELVPRARVITPNIPEAELLLDRSITTQEELPDAARDLARLGASVLLKAGHLADTELVDIFYNAETGRMTRLPAPRVATRNTHGTGCTLSSAFAASLAKGMPLDEASRAAKAYIAAAIAAVTIAAAAAGGYFGLCGWVQSNGQLLPGAVARDDKGAAVDLGRLSREDALSAVTQEMDQRLDSRKLTLLYGEGKKAELSGELMACSPAGAGDVGFSAKENTPFWKLGALWLGMAQEPHDLPLSAAAFTPEGREQAKEVIRSIASELDVEPVDFTYELGDETVVVTPGTDGQKVDTDALLEAVESALAQGAEELAVEPEAVSGAELSGQALSELIHIEPAPPGVDENGKLTPAVIGRSVNAQEAQ